MAMTNEVVREAVRCLTKKLEVVEAHAKGQGFGKGAGLAGSGSLIMNEDFEKCGDWEEEDLQEAGYYSKIQDGLFEMQGYPETEAVYWEMVGLYKDLFVEFYLDQSEGWLYQTDVGGENYGLRKGSNQWDLVDEWPMNHCVRVPRRYAERLEENWRESWNAGC